MTSPKTPGKFKPIRDLKSVDELIERLQLIERDRRVGLLADYLCDLRREMLWVMHELDGADFDVCDFLENLTWNEIADDDDDGDDKDDDNDDGSEPAGVH